MLALFAWCLTGICLPGHHTRAVQTGIRYGMILFIVSEMMLFRFLLGFWHSSLANSIELAGVCPRGIAVMDPLEFRY
jgi:heme/copper-type cytochrome/quinol oxidase subunit 3